MSTFDTVVAILGTHLGLGDRAKSFTSSTPLLGAVPELDSMAIVAVLTAFEERFDLIIADDEIDASRFATVGTLVAWLETMVGA